MKNIKLLIWTFLLNVRQKTSLEFEKKSLLNRIMLLDDFLYVSWYDESFLRLSHLDTCINFSFEELIFDFKLRDKIKKSGHNQNKKKQNAVFLSKDANSSAITLNDEQLNQINNAGTPNLICNDDSSGQLSSDAITLDLYTEHNTPILSKDSDTSSNISKNTFQSNNNNHHELNNFDCYESHCEKLPSVKNLIQHILEPDLFFDKLLENIDKETREGYFKYLSEQKKVLSRSIYNLKLPIKKLGAFNEKFKLDVTKYVFKIESSFYIRYMKVARTFVTLSRRNIENVFWTGTESEINNFYHCFETYFTSSLSQKYFENNKSQDQQLDLDSNIILNCKKLLSSFEEYKLEFMKSYDSIFKCTTNNYLDHKNNFFWNNDEEVTKQKFKIFLADCFNNEPNILLLILFPELQMFFESIDNHYNFNFFYKKFHLIISVIIFRFHFILPFLREEFSVNGNNPGFLIIESEVFCFFVLEIRMILLFFSSNINFESSQIMVLYLKALLSFIKIKNIKLLKCFLMNEFLDPKLLIKLGYLIDFYSVLYDKTSLLSKKVYAIKLTRILSIDSKLFDSSFIILNDQEKMLKVKNLILDDDYNNEGFIDKNSYIETQINIIFYKLFN